MALSYLISISHNHLKILMVVRNQTH